MNILVYYLIDLVIASVVSFAYIGYKETDWEDYILPILSLIIAWPGVVLILAILASLVHSLH